MVGAIIIHDLFKAMISTRMAAWFDIEGSLRINNIIAIQCSSLIMQASLFKQRLRGGSGYILAVLCHCINTSFTL